MYEDYPHVHKVSAQFKPQREVTYEDFQERRNLEDKVRKMQTVITLERTTHNLRSCTVA